jgi:hypothetical protein
MSGARLERSGPGGEPEGPAAPPENPDVEVGDDDELLEPRPDEPGIDDDGERRVT